MLGRYTVKFSGHYGRKRIPAGRETEGFFRVEYSPEKREIVVREANFGYHLAHLREDFKWMELGREYEFRRLYHGNTGSRTWTTHAPS